MAKTLVKLKEKMMAYKTELEKKGLRVNIGKTKVMCSEYGKGNINKSANYPCGVCGHGVGVNSIKCSKCKQWVHNRCSKVKKGVGKMTTKEADGFVCSKCKFADDRGSGFENGTDMLLSGSDKCEVVDKFCYLGDMISVGGGADAAVVMRISSGWKKFRELKPLLTNRYVSPKIRGDIYSTCVRSVMIHGAETWPMKVAISQLLDRAEMRMVRWICGVSLCDRIASEELRKRLGITNIGEILRRARLRWFGHVMRKDDNSWVKNCMFLEVEGKVPKGNRKTWRKTVDEDMKLKGMKVGDCANKPRWRKGLRMGLQRSDNKLIVEVQYRKGLRSHESR